MAPSPNERIANANTMDKELTALAFDKTVLKKSLCRRRSISENLHTDRLSKEKKNNSKIKNAAKISDSLNIETNDSKINKHCTDIRNLDLCKDCTKLKDKNHNNLTVYHKRKEDRINRNSSIKAALFEWSPKWLKSFLIDPEYVMSGVKSKFQSE